jgi:hypothetical protein
VGFRLRTARQNGGCQGNATMVSNTAGSTGPDTVRA